MIKEGQVYSGEWHTIKVIHVDNWCVQYVTVGENNVKETTKRLLSYDINSGIYKLDILKTFRSMKDSND